MYARLISGLSSGFFMCIFALSLAVNLGTSKRQTAYSRVRVSPPFIEQNPTSQFSRQCSPSALSHLFWRLTTYVRGAVDPKLAVG
jgi:hypothetical protein